MKSSNTPSSQSLSVPMTRDDYKKYFEDFYTSFDPGQVLEKAKKEVEKNKGKNKQYSGETDLFKAMTLFEFDNGSLMINSVPDMYKTFSIDLSRNLQKEYNCTTPSERATAELVAINFVRVLAIQLRMNARLERGEIGELGIQYLNLLSKELDRANRHYLNSLQTLKMIKQPVLEVNIKTQTAVIGQNQVVQTKNEQFN